jgi:hypothetical protein
MSADITPYTNLVTSEHYGKPNFMASVSALVQPCADEALQVAEIIALYDLDVAVGSQLDTVGQWVGQSRDLESPLVGVYFSFDTYGVGFDQGVWIGPYDPVDGLVVLADPEYRTLLRARIAANQWDGTIPTAYAVWSIIFANEPFTILIQDNDDMSMAFILLPTSSTPDAVILLLFAGGYFDLRPDGVQVLGHFTSSIYGAPVFGFDTENQVIAGFDVGAWAIEVSPGTFPTRTFDYEVSDDDYFIVSDDGYFMALV